MGLRRCFAGVCISDGGYGYFMVGDPIGCRIGDGMDTLQLKYFVALSRCLNFTEVASRFYVTQPTVSHQIKRLEESLDVRLFNRNRHNVSLTRFGEMFYNYAVSLIDLAESAETQVQQMKTGTKGFLHLSCVSSMASAMTAYVNKFSERYPEVVVEIECATGLQQIMSINQNRSDLYFSFTNLLENTGHLKLMPLESDRFCIIAHEQYAEIIDPEDFSSLKSLPLIAESHTEGPFLTRKAFALCEEHHFNPRKTLYYSSFLSAVIAIAAGLGFGIFPKRMEEFFPPTLKSFPIPGENAEIENAVAWNEGTDNIAALKFLEIVSSGNKVF